VVACRTQRRPAEPGSGAPALAHRAVRDGCDT
jgi:hypothetical protein